MLTTTLFLESAIGGVIGAAAGKGFGAIGAGRQDGGAEPAAVRTAIEQAVRQSMDALRAQHKETRDDALSRDVLNQLDHPPFAREVAAALIFQGGADLDRLREAYLSHEDDESVSDRWRALEGPLIDLFDEIEERLLKDPVVGPALRDARKLRKLARIEESSLALVVASRVMTRFARENVDAVRDNGGVLRAIEATLGEIADGITGLQSIVDALRARPAVTPSAPESSISGDLTDAEKAYLGILRDRCNRVPLARDVRDDPKRADDQSPRLDQVYVNLDTTVAPSADLVLDRAKIPDKDRAEARERLEAWPTRVEGGTPAWERVRDKDHPLAPWVSDAAGRRHAAAPMTALEALDRQRRMVLLGDPGSGKSTLVNHLTYLLATGCAGADTKPASIVPEGLANAFPIRVEMRKWHAAWRKAIAKDGQHDGIPQGWEILHLALRDLAPSIDEARWNQRLASFDTIVLFDGLDEVPESLGEDESINPRKILVQAVRDFCMAHDRCRVLVTCRVKPYPGYRLEKLHAYALASLSTEKIHQFRARWYTELTRIGDHTRSEAEQLSTRLADALRDRPVLREMASSPLLLTMLAHINARATLPQDEAELYKLCVDQLLWHWERKKETEGGIDSLQRLLDEPHPPIARIDIERVLWHLTYDSYDSGGDLPIGDLETRLAGLHAHPHEGKSWASRLVTLMRERGGLLLDLDDVQLSFPHKSFREYMAGCWLAEQPNVHELAAEKAQTDDNWHEVIAIACGHLRLRGSQATAQSILAELADEHLRGGDARWKRVLLAGRIWRDYGRHRLHDSHAGKKLNRRMELILNKVMIQPKLDAKQRCEAGFILADADVLPKDLDERITIDATDALGYTFQIGKYPVTNHQFRAFVEDGGYDQDRDWWTDEAREQMMQVRSEWPSTPRLWFERTRNRATQPVSAISWFEASAYCAWLTAHHHASGQWTEDQAIRLPTEREWALVAAGDEERPYPWGDQSDHARLNCEESGIGLPTPVNMYPRGATAGQVFDLCGNVWEWTATAEKDDYILAGGCFYQAVESLRSSVRSRFAPADWTVADGFRVVVVPRSRASF